MTRRLHSPQFGRSLVAVPFLASCLLFTGCGGGAKPGSSEVTGSVTYKGAPLTGGTITFAPTNADPLSPEGAAPQSTQIMEDGTYSFKTLHAGMKTVTVETKSAQKMGGMSDAAMKNAPKDTAIPPGYQKKTVAVIPDKYADGTKSGLSFDVQPGKQVKDFPLD